MRWDKNEKTVCEELGDGALLVELATGKRWLLNEAAAALWKLNGAGKSVADFCAQLQTPALFQLAGLVPTMTRLNAANGPRRRPSPRGNSGPG